MSFPLVEFEGKGGKININVKVNFSGRTNRPQPLRVAFPGAHLQTTAVGRGDRDHRGETR